MSEAVSAEKRIADFRPLIKNRARSFHRGWLAKLSTVEELEAVATEAVWRAAATYRNDRNAKFSTYVYHIVTHALSAAAKRARANNRQGITASLSEGPDGEMAYVLVSGIASPSAQLDAMETRRLVREAVDALPPRLKEIIERRYWRDETLNAIGDSWSLSRERIRQLESDAFDRLRPKLDLLWIGMLQEAA